MEGREGGGEGDISKEGGLELGIPVLRRKHFH